MWFNCRGKAIIFILIRYLNSGLILKKTRARTAAASLLPVAGIAVGVAAFIIVMSIMAGLVKNLQSRLLSLESHIEIVKKDSFALIDENQDLLKKISSTSSQILSVCPFQKGDAILQANTRVATIVLVGIDPKMAQSCTEIERLVKQENVLLLNHEIKPDNDESSAAFPTVFVGNQITFHMAVGVGTRATLISVNSEEGPAGLAPKQFPVVIADEINSGNPAYDSKIVYSNLIFANKFFGTEGTWSGIQVRVKDPFNIEKVVNTLNKSLDPQGLRAKPWTEANKTLVRALKLERWGMKFVMFIVILVACFSITITLILTVRRKTAEIAILRAMGMKKLDLGILFVLQGLIIGCFGVILGLGVGLGMLELIKANIFSIITSAYSSQPLPVLVNIEDVFLVSIGSVALATVAALWPALEVMKIDVIDTLSERG